MIQATAAADSTVARAADSTAAQPAGSTAAQPAGSTAAQPAGSTAAQVADMVPRAVYRTRKAIDAADNTVAGADCIHRLVELVSGADSIQQPD